MKCMMCGKETDNGFPTTNDNFVCFECAQSSDITMCSKCETIIESGEPYLKMSPGEFLCAHCGLYN